jgi:hypothetical protein
MPLEARINKFVDCAGAARHPLDKARAMQIVELVTRLEQLPDIRPLMALLA